MERGHLFFFYRPKVDAQEVKGPNDIQKFYILMSPDGAVGRPAKEHEIEGKRGEERAPLDHKGKPLHRLLVVPGKCLPDPNSRRARIWSFVEAASSDLHEVEYHLERYSYDTKTRGHRDIQPARLIAEARYEIVQHSSKDSHLMYELEFPEEPTDVQKAFHIYKQGHFLVTVKNPAFDSPAYSERWAGFKGDAKANFSEELRANFQVRSEGRAGLRITVIAARRVAHCLLCAMLWCDGAGQGEGPGALCSPQHDRLPQRPSLRAGADRDWKACEGGVPRGDGGAGEIRGARGTQEGARRVQGARHERKGEPGCFDEAHMREEGREEEQAQRAVLYVGLFGARRERVECMYVPPCDLPGVDGEARTRVYCVGQRGEMVFMCGSALYAHDTTRRLPAPFACLVSNIYPLAVSGCKAARASSKAGGHRFECSCC